MEFKFNVNKLLPNKINKITHTLVPEGFEGSRRELNECQRQLTRILDDMGEASARAQGLNKPITSAHKLRDTDHIVYLLVDDRANNEQGAVVGLLKTGSKNLFMFDKAGVHHQLKPRCVLDFYVHESRQRMGLGNILYQYMLAEEKVEPTKLAIDRPSEKFLAFLRKYYGLSGVIPQNNKFVVFHGFFDDETASTRDHEQASPMDNSVGNNKLPNLDRRDFAVGANRSNSVVNGIGSRASTVPSASAASNVYGRYAAARPPCSMADIIHNTTTVLGQSVERTGDKTSSNNNNNNGSDNGFGSKAVSATIGGGGGGVGGGGGWAKVERPRSLSLYSEDEQKQRRSELPTVPTPVIPDEQQRPPSFASIHTNEMGKGHEGDSTETSASSARLAVVTPSVDVQSSPSCARQRVITVKHAGHIDLKFYHSPLW